MISLRFGNQIINNIDTILFDKDGTFIDLHYFWGKMTELRVEEISKKYNLKCFDKLCLLLGYDRNTGEMLKDGITALYSRPTIIKIFCQNLREMSVKTSENDIEEIFDNVNVIFYKDMVKYTKPILPAIEFIKKVHSLGVKTGIVTSDSKESTLLTLKHFHWEDIFDVAIGREDTKETKESGAPVRLALELLSSSATTSLMVGDAPMDFLAAKNGGIDKTILVATGQIGKLDLCEVSPYCVDSLDELEIIS